MTVRHPLGRRTRGRAAFTAAALAVVLAAAGCSPSDGSGAGATPAAGAGATGSAPGGSGGGGSPSAAALPPLSQAEAAAVFKHYGEVRAAANATRDDAKLAEIEDGPLLAASTAAYRMERLGGDKPLPFEQSTPYFLVPRREGYPRYFAVLARNSRWIATSHGRDLMYFRQQTAGGPWKAVFQTPINVKNGDAGQSATDPTYTPKPTASPTVTYHPDQKPPSKLPNMPVADGDFVRTVDGQAAVTAAKTCTDYAAYHTRSIQGPQARDRFVAGDLTTGITAREAERARALGEISWTRTFRPTTDPGLPLLRLGDGTALVPCTFDKVEVTDSPRAPERWVSYDQGDKVLRFLGPSLKWSHVERTSADFAVIAAPTDGSAADVLFMHDTLLSATGTPIP
ncbi:hypothetical protein [Yinghuangia soli]|uniref:DUF8094 domain-containing protein n=1 Tax=Yinghuangia soli TaxID=2908204 RepID=A0AA41PWI8_9ACTN|nr:hypothetical protein [Yinghuangia soli]MCF2526164.1 hypothetical protein [Yinghuangia soli]